MSDSTENRQVPKLPGSSETIRLIIDTDAANEIDDLYAVTLALASPERFEVEGLVASHFAGKGGPDGIDLSYRVILELLDQAGLSNDCITKKGSHPMRYPCTPENSEGVEFLIDTALSASEDEPLWVVCLGVATDLASAILKAPEIIPKVRYVFHARSEMTWPQRSVQFNVYGDIIAAKTLLESRVPLVWFDTGTHICASMETTEREVAPHGSIGRFLHEYRKRDAWYMRPDKGFYDMGDIAFLIEPSVCRTEIIDAPEMTRWMYFNREKKHGQILKVSDIDVDRTWQIFFERLEKRFG